MKEIAKAHAARGNGYDCDGNCLVDTDGDGVCDGFESAGCQDAEACNYDADATDDDGSCTNSAVSRRIRLRRQLTEAGYDVDGNGLNDVDEIVGCTVEYACQDNPTATEADDESCFYATEGLRLCRQLPSGHQ